MSYFRFLGMVSGIALITISCSKKDTTPTSPTPQPPTIPALVVVSQNPSPGETGVSCETEIGLAFSREIDTTNIDVGTFLIEPAISGTVHYTDTSVFLVPATPLSILTTYRVTVSGIRGRADQDSLEVTEWSFTTRGTSQSWQKTFNRPGLQYLRDVVESPPGELVMLGRTYVGGDAANDYWVIKCDLDGNILWENTYGIPGDGDNNPVKLIAGAGGGYVILGRLLVKLDNDGDTVWTQFIDNRYTRSISLHQGGYLLAGNYGADYSHFSYYGGMGIWLAWMSGSGTITNTDVLSDGMNGRCMVTEVLGSSRGSYMMAGYNDYDYYNYDSYFAGFVAGEEGGEGTSWLSKCADPYPGGVSDDWLEAAVTTPDGGAIAVGQVKSTGADWDVYVVKVSASGVVQWKKAFGGSYEQTGVSVDVTADGGYIVAANPGEELYKLDSFGNVEWKRSWWQSRLQTRATLALSDGGYMLAGSSQRIDEGDIFIIKTDCNGDLAVPGF